jgi:hypothetical protein
MNIEQFEQNILDIQSLKNKREKQHCSRKICENKKSFITKEIIQMNEASNEQYSIKKSKSTRLQGVTTNEYKLNKEETFIFGSSELKPERTQGAIFIEKLGQFTVKSEVKPKVIAEEIQSILQERNDSAEIVLPAEKQKDSYEFMIFDDDFKNLLESKLDKSNNFTFIYKFLFLVERLEVICDIALNKLYKSIFTDNAPSSGQTENYLSKTEIIDELMMPVENETFKKYLQEASLLDML